MKKIWEVTSNRFVAFIDILGFKDMVARKRHEDVYDSLKKLFSLSSLLMENEHLKNDIYITKFSDSIVIFSRGDDIANIHSFIHVVRLLFAGSMINGLPLKGAIAYGKISLDIEDSIFFGQALIDAYLLEEDVNYYGVVCHNSFERRIKELDYEDVMLCKLEVFFKLKTALKSGLITHLNLDWYDDVDVFKVGINLKSVLESMYFETSGSPRKYLDNTFDMYERFWKSKKENKDRDITI